MKPEVCMHDGFLVNDKGRSVERSKFTMAATSGSTAIVFLMRLHLKA